MDTKICSDCKTEKSITDFYINKRVKSGYFNYCINCHAVRSKKWYLANRHKRDTIDRRQQARKQQERKNLLLLQGGRCAICKIILTETKDMHWDHDHSCCNQNNVGCNKCVRGIVCGGCNRGLGHFKDNIISMQNAITYLKLYQEV